jgi:hypothetical protein
MTVTADEPSYRPNNVIEFTAEINNPNDEDFLDAYLNFTFNEGFMFVPGSLLVTDQYGNRLDGETKFVQGHTNDIYFVIAGAQYQDSTLTESDVEGFTLPSGKISMTFKLQAPSIAEDELDANLHPTGKKIDFEMVYTLSSTVDDPCAAAAMEGLDGHKILPFAGISHIKTNRFNTIRLRRR